MNPIELTFTNLQYYAGGTGAIGDGFEEHEEVDEFSVPFLEKDWKVVNYSRSLGSSKRRCSLHENRDNECPQRKTNEE